MFVRLSVCLVCIDLSVVLEEGVNEMWAHSGGEYDCLGGGGMKCEEECMGLGLTTQLQRQVGTQIAKLIIFTPSRVNLNKRNSIHPYELYM